MVREPKKASGNSRERGSKNIHASSIGLGGALGRKVVVVGWGKGKRQMGGNLTLLRTRKNGNEPVIGLATVSSLKEGD